MLVFYRLIRFIDKAKSVLDYFEPYLGRIEIMGSAGRIERVYFEIKQSNVDQWEKPQIKVCFKIVVKTTLREVIYLKLVMTRNTYKPKRDF